MKPFRTYQFSTDPGMTLSEVAKRMNTQVSLIFNQGYEVMSIQPHMGVVDGVSQTVGYTILTREIAYFNKSANDDMPVLAISV